MDALSPTISDIEKMFDLDRFRGLTYGSVLIPPMGMNVADSRSDVSLATKFSKKIPLNQPVVSANMLDITESKMAITNAFKGGIGIIHRFCLPDNQAKEVRITKRAHNFIIDDPYYIRRTASVKEARARMQIHQVGSLLVTNDNGELVGLLTTRDLRFVEDLEVVENRMTPREKLRVSQVGEIKFLEDAVKMFRKYKIKKLPVVDGNNHIRGLISAKDVERLQRYPMANLDSHGRLVVGAAIGAIGDYIERAQELKKARADVLVMDVTSAHSKFVEKAVIEFRKKLGDYELVVGNIGTAEQADFLIKLGVDGIKIGIGPGGVCTTRKNTGIGVPQLFAILEIYWNLIFKYKYKPEEIPPLCADGNIRCGADIFHALMAGASSVMIGTLFSATEETPGMAYKREDGEYKPFRGMASVQALIARYEAEGIDDPVVEAFKKSPEGMDREIKVKGSAQDIISNLVGGVRSGVTHRGVLTLKDAKAQFNPFDHATGFDILQETARKESFER